MRASPSSLGELLRAEGTFAPESATLPWCASLAIFAASAFVYGLALGSYELRALQALYSAVKLPLLLALSTAICFPNFFAVNTVLGLREDFAHACRGLLAAQATVALALASLAPLALLAYASACSYRFAVVMNGALCAIAAVAGQVTLQRHYRPLEARNPRHRVARRAWLLLYVFVAIQLAWLLRPFVGSPDVETRFLREDAWDNAYVIVARTVWELFSTR